MIVYQTNYDGVFVGPVEADPSPLEPGKFLIPGGCVLEPPPEFGEGFFARWNFEAQTWTVEAVPPPPPPPEPEPAPEPEPTP